MVVLSAPSGGGKTTLASALLKAVPELALSVSACTRSPRRAEEEGKHYYFLSPTAFRQGIKANVFLEWEEVYEGQYYGTPKSELSRLAASKKHVLFDIDVKGALRLRSWASQKIALVFISPPSLETLALRLQSRGTDDATALQQRLARAEEEMAAAKAFDYEIINRDSQEAAQELIQITQRFLASP